MGSYSASLPVLYWETSCWKPEVAMGGGFILQNLENVTDQDFSFRELVVKHLSACPAPACSPPDLSSLICLMEGMYHTLHEEKKNQSLSSKALKEIT